MGALMGMMKQQMTATNAYFTATGEKLDTIGGRPVQNEVRIAHLEGRLEERAQYMVNRLDQRGKHAISRLQQQDKNIQHMGHVLENYHKTELGRLDEFGRAQEALQGQLADQCRQRGSREIE